MPYVYPGTKLGGPLPTQTTTDANGRVVTVLLTFNATPRPLDDQPAQVAYVELVDGYRESFPVGAMEATRMCCCMWSDRWQFARNILGYSDLIPTIQGQNYISRSFDIYQNPSTQVQQTSYIRRFPPEPHPDYPFLFAAEIGEVRGLGVPNGGSTIAKCLSTNPQFGQTVSSMMNQGTFGAQFNVAVMPVIYRPRDYLIYGNADIVTSPFTPGQGELNRYVSRYVKLNGENLPVPGNTFKYVNDQTPLLQAQPKVFPSLHLVWKWWQVPSLDGFTQTQIARTNVGALQGYINSELFDGFDPGTILCLPPDMSRPYVMPNGFVAQDIEFNCIFRKTGHNKLYRGNAVNDFVEVSTDGQTHDSKDTTHHIYPGADLNQLFQLSTTVTFGA